MEVPSVNSLFYHYVSFVLAVLLSGALVLTIMDNGQGMSRERIEAVLNSSSAEGLRSTGLASAAARLKMYFGAAYGLDIDSEPGVGTRIAVRLPKMKTNEEWEEKTR